MFYGIHFREFYLPMERIFLLFLCSYFIQELISYINPFCTSIQQSRSTLAYPHLEQVSADIEAQNRSFNRQNCHLAGEILTHGKVTI